ncbi:hybrid sensor histidine kinase/response regulator [Desulfonatronovibrio hydrogenovorans]|uniref:hybrid sensor histidine kinase/response regulator n=1 Tax=Desulfonatronovibrio hydrogenovorans TaxID=53245 RepID=UPI00068A8E0A|nr:hybrid sensor histidine kinase/response regulator [Desulfonatronovibrio hydrogenovorans]
MIRDFWKYSRRLSIRTRLSITLVLAVIIPMALVSLGSMHMYVERDREVLHQDLLNSLHKAELVLIRHIRQAETLAQHLATIVRTMPEEEIQGFLDASRDFWFLGLVEVFDRDRALLGRSFAQQAGIDEYFLSRADPLLKEVLELNVQTDLRLLGKGLAVQSAVPVIEPGTMEPVGAVVVTFPVTVRFLQSIKEQVLTDLSIIPLSGQGLMVSTLQDEQGVFVTRFWRDEPDQSALDRNRGPFYKQLAGSQLAVAYSDLKSSQDESLALLAVSLDPSIISQNISQGIRFITLSSMAAFGVALLMGFVTAASFINPLRRLTSSVGSVAQGDLHQRVDINRKDELGELAGAFNEMTSRLEKKHQDLNRAIEEKNRYSARLEENRIRLEEFNRELEETVINRTREILDKNRALKQEVLERQRTEARLAMEKEQLDVTLRSIGDGVIVTDIRARVVLINPAAEEIIGVTKADSEDRDLEEVLQTLDVDAGQPVENPALQALAAGDVVQMAGNTRIIHQDGQEVFVAISCAPIRDFQGDIKGSILIIRDVSGQRKMEQDMLKIQKLESLGLIAGGLAHDFNNILTAIGSHINLARIHLPHGLENTLAKLDQAEKACLRASDLTRQLLTFAKGGAPVRRWVSPGDLVRSSVEFILAGTRVKPDFTLPEDLWMVHVDPGQISQVINNLVLNSVQAMEDGGAIQVQGTNLDLTGTQKDIPLKPGRYVTLSLTDSGEGIPEVNLSKIFDPYFTTRATGTGLGLSIVYSIVKQHDGHVRVWSEQGRGATFTLYLPAGVGPEIQEPGLDDQDMKDTTARVLFMDDEEMIRESVQELLQAEGFEVDVAAHGLEAVEKYEAALNQGRSYQVVIMDLTVPGGMGGLEAMTRLKEMDPGVKAVVSSGYSHDPVMAGYLEYGFVEVLAKPYPLTELIRVIRRVVRDQSSAGCP